MFVLQRDKGAGPSMYAGETNGWVPVRAKLYVGVDL
jgi:hypothetical protein